MIWPFYGLLQLYEKKCQKTHIPANSFDKYRKFCIKLMWPFYGLLQPYKQKCHKTHLRDFSSQESQVLF